MKIEIKKASLRNTKDIFKKYKRASLRNIKSIFKKHKKRRHLRYTKELFETKKDKSCLQKVKKKMFKT